MAAYILLKTPSGSYDVVRFDVVFSENHTNESTLTEHPVEQGVDVADHSNPKLYEVVLSAFVSNTPLQIVPGTRGADGFKPLDGEAGLLTVGNQTVSVPTGSVTTQRNSAILPGVPFRVSANPIGLLQNAANTAPKSISIGGFQYNDGPDGQIKVSGFQLGNTKMNRVAIVDDQLRAMREQAVVIQLVTTTRTYDSMMVVKHTVSRTPEDGSGATFEITVRQIRIVNTKVVTAPVPTEVRGKVEVSKGSTSGKDVPPGDTESVFNKLWGRDHPPVPTGT